MSGMSFGMLVVLALAGAARAEDASMTRSNPGMMGLYDMANSFLGDVAPQTFGEFLGTADSVDELDFLELLKTNIGLLIAMGVGVLFIIVSCCTGCCYCCCRTCCGGCCCRKCQSKSAKTGAKPSMCWTLVCTGLAIGTGVIMFSFVITAFVSSGLVVDEVSEHLFTDVSKSVRQTQNFSHTIADDLDTHVTGNLAEIQEGIEKSLIHLPETIMDTVNDETKAEDSLNELESFTNSLPRLETDLGNMDSADLTTLEDNLESEINIFTGGALGTHLDTCSSSGVAGCTEAKVKLDDLQVTKIGSNLTDTSTAEGVVANALANDIDVKVNALVQNLDDVSTEIENEINGTVTEVIDQLDDVAGDVSDALGSATDSLRDVDLEDTAKSIEETSDTVEPYMGYVSIALYSLPTIMLIITLLGIIGALLGLFGGSSSKAHGANCMLAGVSLTFIFSWIFMILTIVWLLLGASLDMIVCRDMVGMNEGFDNVFEKLVPDSNFNLSVRDVVENCKANQPIYEALDLEENGFNITELLDLEQYGIYDEMRKLANITFNLGTVTIITEEVNTTMRGLDQALDQVDYGKNLDELKRDITTINLDDYVQELQAIIDELDGSAPAGDIATEKAKLEAIIQNEYAAVEDERNNIQAATVSGQDISSVNLVQITDDLAAAESVLNNDLDTMISDIMNVTVEELIAAIDNGITRIEDGIRNDLVKCRPLFDIFQTLVYAPCVYFLYPVHGLWFSYGAVLFFSVPGIVFATKTVSYFRRMNKYTKVTAEGGMPMQDYKPPPKNAVAPV